MDSDFLFHLKYKLSSIVIYILLINLVIIFFDEILIDFNEINPEEVIYFNFLKWIVILGIIGLNFYELKKMDDDLFHNPTNDYDVK